MKTIQETVHQLFIATDQKDWTTVETAFAQEVSLDYSSMSGQPAAVLTPQQITDAWKSILPGFEHTHHQIGNMITNADGNQATVFCYGTATHYLNHKAGNVWTVVGTYDFDLEKDNDAWKISKMKFNFKYQDGNTELPQLASERAK